MKLLGARGYKDAHKKGKYTIPQSLREKDPDYFLKWAEYIYAEYTSGYTTVPYGGVNRRGRSFVDLRNYALGAQSERQYMDILDACDPKDDEGFMNVNTDIVQLLPKYVDILKGKLMGMEFEVQTQAVDESSTKERILKVNKMKMAAHPQMRQIMQSVGRQPQNVKLPKFVETPDDIEELEKLGGIRLQREMVMKDAIEITKYESDWEMLKELQAFDIICTNICASLTKVEQATGKVKVYHIPPENLICRASNFPNHQDIDYAGFVRSMTIEELRRESNLDEEQLKEIAKKYMNFGPNEGFDKRNINLTQPTSSDGVVSAHYDNLRVDVMEYYFIAKEAEDYIIGYRPKEGNMIYDQVPLDAELTKKDQKKGKQKETKVVEWCYKGCWVIGTKFCYDIGKEYAVVKEKSNGVKCARLPITIYSSNSPSIVERCIAHIDDIQIATLKMRNLIAKLPPAPRMIIDLSTMEDTIEIGGKEYDMLKLGKIYTNTGVQFVKSKSEYGDPEMASNRRPIETQIQSGIESDMQVFLGLIQDKINMIRQVTGVNEVADGSTQQRDMLKGVMKGLEAATNNSLKPHFRVYAGHELNWTKYAMLKWQIALISGDVSGEYSPLGDSAVKHIKLTSDLYNYDFAIHLVPLPNEEERNLMLQDLLMKRQESKISEKDYLVVYRMIKTGDIKKAQVFLARAVEKQEQVLHQRQLQMLQEQGKANAQAAIAAEQERAKTARIEADEKIRIQEHKYQKEQEKMRLNSALKMQEMDKQAALGIGGGLVDATTKTALEMQKQINQEKEDSA